MSSAVMCRGLDCSSNSRIRMRGWVTLSPTLRRSCDSIFPVVLRTSQRRSGCAAGTGRETPDERGPSDGRAAMASVYHRPLLTPRLSPLPVSKTHDAQAPARPFRRPAHRRLRHPLPQPIYQGNLLEKTNVDQLQAGMSKQQVMLLLGTPSIADPFHHERWDYTATQRVGRVGQHRNQEPDAVVRRRRARQVGRRLLPRAGRGTGQVVGQAVRPQPGQGQGQEAQSLSSWLTRYRKAELGSAVVGPERIPMILA